MFRPPVLSWLLIVASIAADWVMVVRDNPTRWGGNACLAGLVLGQIGALAIWATSGRQHRLARAGLLVVVTGIAAVATGEAAARNVRMWLALLAGYASFACLIARIVDFCKARFGARLPRSPISEYLRIPLIEFFGWTLVIAMVSFATRYMDFSFLERGMRVAMTMVGILAVVALGKALFAARFTFVELAKLVVFVGAAYGLALGIVAQRARSRLLVTVMVVQASYLAVWFIIQSIEARDSDDRMTEDEPADETDPSSLCQSNEK